MDSNVGLAIQCVGVLLVTLLSLFMRGSISSPALKYWTIAWASLALALMSLFIGFTAFPVGAAHNLLYSLYFFGEYAFGLMFIAGCRYHSSGGLLTKTYLYLFGAAIVVAAVLPHASADFNDLFMIHSLLLSSLFATSLITLRSGHQGEKSPGVRVMSVALFLLALDFLHYLPAFGARKGLWGFTVPAGYLKFTSILDLLLEILLGFGTTMVLMEGVRHEVEVAHGKLIKVRDKLELLARIDPLTEALNRHAFHSLLSRSGEGQQANTSGSVAIIDIDNLKPINDTLGHTAGDKAIRAVASGIRSLIRADDMLFRWGGDEFLVLMFKLQQAETERRMQKLNTILENNDDKWTMIPIKVTVSHGVAGFESLTDLGTAIEKADKSMYERRQQDRQSRGVHLPGAGMRRTLQP
jgi:diguanylate cyclase